MALDHSLLDIFVILEVLFPAGFYRLQEGGKSRFIIYSPDNFKKIVEYFLKLYWQHATFFFHQITCLLGTKYNKIWDLPAWLHHLGHVEFPLEFDTAPTGDHHRWCRPTGKQKYQMLYCFKKPYEKTKKNQYNYFQTTFCYFILDWLNTLKKDFRNVLQK